MRISISTLDLEAGSCRGKRAYMSFREAADKAAASRNHTGENIQAYQCPYCLLFHMGLDDMRPLTALDKKGIFGRLGDRKTSDDPGCHHASDYRVLPEYYDRT